MFQQIANNTPDANGLRGVIINCASVAAIEGQKGQVAYGASKGAVVAMTLPMARDLGTYGIRVLTIAPGIFSTPMMAAASDQVKAGLAVSVVAPKRLGLPEEFAQLALHIIDNAYLNGETIRLECVPPACCCAARPCPRTNLPFRALPFLVLPCAVAASAWPTAARSEQARACACPAPGTRTHRYKYN